MKFYGNGTVWDKDNNRALCSFVNGELETDDERVVAILQDLGYRSDEVGRETIEGNKERQEAKAEQAEADYEEMTYAELKESAKAKGFTVGHKSKADLIDMLKAGE